MRILDENACWGRPTDRANGTGALVLAGSSGRIDTARVEMLRSRGVTPLGLRWFGGVRLPAVPVEAPSVTADEQLQARKARRTTVLLFLGGDALGAAGWLVLLR